MLVALDECDWMMCVCASVRLCVRLCVYVKGGGGERWGRIGSLYGPGKH